MQQCKPNPNPNWRTYSPSFSEKLSSSTTVVKQLTKHQRTKIRYRVLSQGRNVQG